MLGAAAERAANREHALALCRMGWGVGVRWDSRILLPGFDSRPLHRHEMPSPGTGPGDAQSGTREYRKPTTMNGGNQAGEITARKRPGTESLPRLLTTEQTSTLTNIPERTLWRYSRSGIMPAPRKIGHLVRYDREQILAWLATGCPRIDGASAHERQ